MTVDIVAAVPLTGLSFGMRAAGLDFVPDRSDPDEDWYGFPTIRPATR